MHCVGEKNSNAPLLHEGDSTASSRRVTISTWFSEPWNGERNATSHPTRTGRPLRTDCISFCTSNSESRADSADSISGSSPLRKQSEAY